MAVVVLALAANGPLSAAAADEQITKTQAVNNPAQQQSQDEELIKSIDIWQLVDQDSSQETPISAAAEPTQKAVAIETQRPAEETTTQQEKAESAAAVPEQMPPASSADLSSGQQNKAEPVQGAVTMKAQSPAEEPSSEKPAIPSTVQQQPPAPPAVSSGQQNNGAPAQSAATQPSWPDQEIIVIDAPAPTEEKPTASSTSPLPPAAPAVVSSGQQNNGAPAQSAATQPVRQNSGWPVPEPPQAALVMPSASAGEAAQQPQPSSTAFSAPVPTALAAQDDIVAAVEEAMRQYRNKDFVGAVSNLDYAAHLIRQKKTELLKGLLPEPFYGWQAKEAVSQSLGTAVFGGGSTVSRDYFTQTGSVSSIEIVSDSPVLQSIIMMLNNPLFAGASGGNLKTIKRQRAMIKYNDEEHSGEINVVVASRFIVTVKGRGIDLTWLLRYAEAMDFDALAKN